ncbi:Pimeloyl-ACP methyl ester carboxylesterase [Sphingomonas guangdongensis]|uniref:Palmitoyl-protein thioesterase ABHD10, mitochondrial n=1 Tax=Sphingomonas guangdongensis TaxID=1141890 RepID=A0A285QYX3_9SPHN|nr:alpha/beta hydrolase [Sphingomonas guangdongensis]SOB86668.1 Pimeloyl-ACP methyl ester carboxylesterase [Sphingomonas guangdongensis]
MSNRSLAYHHTPGTGPTLIFLPGYASDMTGSKALAVEAWAKAYGRAAVRFDYSGCGASPGAFEEGTLAAWRDDALAIVDELVDGPVVLVGSSMGGWIALLVALARPERVAAIVGIAPAPDFTDWGFTPEEKVQLLSAGRIERPSPYGPAPTVFTRAFWSSGESLRLMHGPIAVDCPVRLIQGQRDGDVPWERTLHLASLIRSADVQLTLIKDGDHRLSRDADIGTLISTIEMLTP